MRIRAFRVIFRKIKIFCLPMLLTPVVLGTALNLLTDSAAFAQSSGLSPAEQIYADLAKLPPAERTAQMEAGARKEGSISIIQTVRNNIGIGQIDMFQKRYPFLKLDITNSLGSPEGAERLYTEESAGRHLTDTINVTIFDMSELLKDNMLARFPTPETARILPKYRNIMDPDNRYTPVNWSERGMVYNTNLVPPDKAPKKWMDLCNPFFKGNFSFDPVQERLVAGFYALFGARTVDFIRCLGANKPIVQRGIQERFALMMAGDHMVDADAYPYQAIAEKRKNPNVPLAISPAPVLAGFGAIGINRNTTHPYASALFTDFMLSDAEQNFLFQHLRGPVTLKHPYLPDDANIIVIPELPDTQLAPLVDEWRRDLDTRQ